MPIACKLIVQQSTNSALPDSLSDRTAGWSEVAWRDGVDLDGAADEFTVIGGVGNVLINRRAALLSNNGAIKGVRLSAYELVDQVLVPTGAARVLRIGKQGTWRAAPDVPSSSILISTGFLVHSNRTRIRLAGIPDAQVVLGEFEPADAYRFALNNYMLALANGFGSVIQDVRTKNPLKILTINDAGQVHTKVKDASIVVGSLVKISRTKGADGKRHGGVYKVASVFVAGQIFTLKNWTHGASTGGTVFIHKRAFARYNVDELKFVRSVNRRVGAPFDRYRGRRSRTPL